MLRIRAPSHPHGAPRDVRSAAAVPMRAKIYVLHGWRARPPGRQSAEKPRQNAQNGRDRRPCRRGRLEGRADKAERATPAAAPPLLTQPPCSVPATSVGPGSRSRHILHAVHAQILHLVADDMRPQLGCYGHDFMKTPHLDHLSVRPSLSAFDVFASPSFVDWHRRRAARIKRKLHRVGPNLWANFKAIIGIFSPSVGPSLAIWANPVQFSFQLIQRVLTLQATGLHFDFAYTNFAYCAPSRNSFMVRASPHSWSNRLVISAVPGCDRRSFVWFY